MVVACSFVSVIGLTPAQAQIARVFVSVQGNDANACEDINFPCRTFAGGIARVSAGGEVIVLTTGSYGGTTITKSVAINVPDGLVAFAAQPFTINAPGGTVVLRGLTLKAVNAGVGTGITVTAAAHFHLEHSVIAAWDTGVFINADANVTLVDTIVRNCVSAGVVVGSANARVSVENSKFENTLFSGFVVSSGRASVKTSVSSNNGSIGFYAFGAGSTLSVDKCLISNNQQGVTAENTALARVSNSEVTDNVTGLFNACPMCTGTIETLGNNTIRGNAANTSGTITVVSPQ